MTYGSTFSGIGGFDLGFDQAGFTPLWQVENDKECNRVLKRHWPDNVARANDIKDLKADGSWRAPDVIFGGFPCQDLSVAGRREGLAGKRSGLWTEFHRVIAEFVPRICVIENVPGLFSSVGGRDFVSIIRSLTELGYCIAWRVLDSQYFGVSQRRRRVFIVGSLGNGCAAQILFEPESVRGDSAPSREKREDITRATALCLNSGRDGYNDGSDQTYVPNISAALRERDHKGPPMDVSEINLIAVSGALSAHSKRHGHAMTTQQAAESGQLIAFGHCDSDPRATTGETSPTLRSTMADKGHKNTSSHVAVAVPILEAGARTGKSTDDKRVRRLTPRECERLQGFPDDWTRFDANDEELSDSARYRMLGNAVTVPVARWIAERIKLVDLQKV